MFFKKDEKAEKANFALEQDLKPIEWVEVLFYTFFNLGAW